MPEALWSYASFLGHIGLLCREFAPYPVVNYAACDNLSLSVSYLRLVSGGQFCKTAKHKSNKNKAYTPPCPLLPLPPKNNRQKKVDSGMGRKKPAEGRHGPRNKELRHTCFRKKA